MLDNDLERALRAIGNFIVIWNGPNLPECAPVEQAWRQIKNYVRWRWTGRRTAKVLAEDVIDGMFSDKLVREGYTTSQGGDSKAPRGLPQRAARIDHSTASFIDGGLKNTCRVSESCAR